MNEFVVVIPARYASQRLPGKALRDLAGKPMLQHVFERASESDASETVVATDDERIASVARGFGAKVWFTSPDHQSGTERLAEVCRIRGWPDDKLVVNLQGDEPLMPAGLINQCAALLENDDADIATLASPIETWDEFENPNVVKVVVDAHDDALYFSRAPIPYLRGRQTGDTALRCALRHHGIYAYRAGVLQRFVNAAKAPLEECEQLEQLRALTMGLTIRVGLPSRRPGPGVDTEADLRQVTDLLARQGAAW